VWHGDEEHDEHRSGNNDWRDRPGDPRSDSLNHLRHLPWVDGACRDGPKRLPQPSRKNFVVQARHDNSFLSFANAW
jgi:hypothetical protein